jgi:hypothetical protein
MIVLLGALVSLNLSAAPSVTIVFQGDNRGEVAPCG